MFVAYLLTRNIRYEEDLVDQLFNSSEKRLARVLLLPSSVRQGRKTGSGDSPNQSGNSGRDGGNDSRASKFLHEQVPEVRIHRLSRWRSTSGSQFTS